MWSYSAVFAIVEEKLESADQMPLVQHWQRGRWWGRKTWMHQILPASVMAEENTDQNHHPVLWWQTSRWDQKTTAQQGLLQRTGVLSSVLFLFLFLFLCTSLVQSKAHCFSSAQLSDAVAAKMRCEYSIAAGSHCSVPIFEKHVFRLPSES